MQIKRVFAAVTEFQIAQAVHYLEQNDRKPSKRNIAAVLGNWAEGGLAEVADRESRVASGIVCKRASPAATL